MTEYIAWRVSSRLWSKWHIRDAAVPFGGDQWTLCGKVYSGGAQVAGERRKNAKDTCRTCTNRQQREKR